MNGHDHRLRLIEMAALDQLPKAVRQRLAHSPFHFKPTQIVYHWLRHGLTIAETLGLIDALEDWAREETKRATELSGNQLVGLKPPRIDDIVADVKKPGC
jgi:hypothetical protein